MKTTIEIETETVDGEIRYCSSVKEMPGCFSEASDLSTCLVNTYKAIVLWQSAAEKSNYENTKSTEGVFVHQCITPGCGTLVEYDDEPCCFKHSPDEGSHLPFYSARERLTQGITPPT